MQFRAISRLYTEEKRKVLQIVVVVLIIISVIIGASSSLLLFSSLVIKLSFTIFRCAHLLGAYMARQKFPSGICQLGAHAHCRALVPWAPLPLPFFARASTVFSFIPWSRSFSTTRKKSRDKITPRHPSLALTLFHALAHSLAIVSRVARTRVSISRRAEQSVAERSGAARSVATLFTFALSLSLSLSLSPSLLFTFMLWTSLAKVGISCNF